MFKMNTSKFSYENPQPFIKIKSNANTEDTHYCILYEDITKDCKRYAEKVLNETEEKKAEGIRKLKEFLHKENIKYPEEIDDLIVIVMRHCKYNMKKTESELKHLIQLRQDIIQRMKEMGKNKLEMIIDDISVGCLPYRDKEGRVIVFTRPNYMEYHLDAYTLDDLVICTIAVILFLLSFPMTSIYGLVYLAETKCQSQLLLFRKMKGMLYAVAKYWVNFPVRIKRVAFLNESIFVRIIHRALTPFLPRKLRTRISFHGDNYSSLFINPEILPTDFGGNLGPVNNTFYREKLLLFIAKLLDEDKESP